MQRVFLFIVALSSVCGFFSSTATALQTRKTVPLAAFSWGSVRGSLEYREEADNVIINVRLPVATATPTVPKSEEWDVWLLLRDGSALRHIRRSVPSGPPVVVGNAGAAEAVVQFAFEKIDPRKPTAVVWKIGEQHHVLAIATTLFSAYPPPPVPPELARKALDFAKACIGKSPEGYRSVWGSPLNFDQAGFSQRIEPDHVSVRISERAGRGMPQGVAIDVNIKTGECVNFTNRLE